MNIQIMNILFHPWFHDISMLSDLPEFTRIHRTHASRLRVGWVVLRHMEVFPPWLILYCNTEGFSHKQRSWNAT